MATAIRISEPGIPQLGIKAHKAGLGSRNFLLGFILLLATALDGEPGIIFMGINRHLAGLGDRIGRMGFISTLATAILLIMFAPRLARALSRVGA